MKKIIGIFIVMLFIITSVMPVAISQKESLHRGSFHAEMGINNRKEAQLELNGNYRDFRNRHIIFGTGNTIGSERTFRFQGITSQNLFLIQSAITNRIVNIIGSFTRYDENNHIFYGEWRGFIAGYGSSRGWIEAKFT